MPTIRSILRRSCRAFCTLSVCLLALFLASVTSFSHEGHAEHDAPPVAQAATFPRVTARSELYDVVGILKNDALTIYVDRVPGNEPATDVSLTVTIGDADPVSAEPTGAGLFSVHAPSLSDVGGSIDIVFSVSAPSGDDLLVGTIAPQSGVAPSPAVAPGWTAILPSPSQSSVFLAITLFVLGIVFGRLDIQKHRVAAIASVGAAFGLLTIVIAGAVSQSSTVPKVPASQFGNPSDSPRRLPDGTAFVSKPSQRLLAVRTVVAEPAQATPGVSLIGRVIGDPNRTSIVQSLHGGRVTSLGGGFPSIGQRVRAGEQLVQVELNLPIADRTTISEKLGEIDQLIAVAEGRLKRLRPLAERGVTPTSQLADAETELEGLRRRRQTVLTTRVDREILTAPTDGVIALAKVVQGQVVQAQDMLFQIIDPSALLVEAIVYGGLNPDTLAKATATVPDGKVMTLTKRGFSRALRHHASIVHFSIDAPSPLLRVGQLLTVTASTGETISGLILPRNAVVRSAAGEAIVWLQVDAERFEPRPVRTQEIDATRLLIADGVNASERIVVAGADLINQVR